MSRYDEICSAFKQSREDWTAYRERANAITARVLTGFVSYLGAPEDRVKYLPPEPRDPKALYGPMIVATMENDGWWVSFVQLTVAAGKNVYRQMGTLFQFRILVEQDSFTVRLGDSKRSHKIADGDDVALQPVYEDAFEAAKRYFTAGVTRFIDEATKKNNATIGFM